MPVPALVIEPVGTVGEDVADPVQSLDIVDQCRASEDADLGNIGRTVAREAVRIRKDCSPKKSNSPSTFNTFSESEYGCFTEISTSPIRMK